MIELEEARRRILDAIHSTKVETIALPEIDGRILAEDLTAPINLPSFDNSAMDGYAVRAFETATGARLQCIGESPAGTVFEGEVGESECVRIFTGSPMPAGANAVVMQEDTRIDGENVEIIDGVKPFENVRLRGEDVKEGDSIGCKGDLLSPGHLALLGSCGVETVHVRRQPIIGLLATGNELREPGAKLAPGEIFESNRQTIARLAELAGAQPRIYPLVPDTLDDTVASLKAAFTECDAVVTSGGVSVGKHDYVKAAFEELGGTLDFWKVRIKPGKPFLCGRLGDRFLFGLPGNPVSAFVTFLLLVRPALLKMSDATNTELPTHPAVLTAPLVNHGNRRNFMRVFVNTKGQAHPAGMQASHALGSLAKANALVDVPPESTLEEKATVSVLRWAP